MGPHEANLRGDLALEQIRAVQEATWPGVQRDIELGRVRDAGEVEVIPVDTALTRDGGAYGIRVAPDLPPVPVAPNLLALPGRYRAWVLPLSGVAVALERLDDEDVYLRAYRTHILSLQGVHDEAAFARLRGRVTESTLEKKNAHASVVSFGKFDAFDAERVGGSLFAHLFIGMRYRRHKRFFGSTIIEPVAPPVVTTTTTGPYR